MYQVLPRLLRKDRGIFEQERRDLIEIYQKELAHVVDAWLADELAGG